MSKRTSIQAIPRNFLFRDLIRRDLTLEQAMDLQNAEKVEILEILPFLEDPETVVKLLNKFAPEILMYAGRALYVDYETPSKLFTELGLCDFSTILAYAACAVCKDWFVEAMASYNDEMPLDDVRQRLSAQKSAVFVQGASDYVYSQPL